MAVNEKTLQVAVCSILFFYSISLLPFPFLAPNFFHLPSLEPVTLLHTFTLSCPHFSFIAILLREGGGMFGEMIRKRAKFGFFYGQVHFCLPFPAARPNGLVQSADFCRKLLEILRVRVCVCVVRVVAIFFPARAHHLLQLWAFYLALYERFNIVLTGHF